MIGVKRNNNLFSEKPEIIFVFASLVMGCMLILAIGTNQVSYDEHVHAARAYDISFGSTIQTTETAMEMKGNNLPYFHSLGERALVEQYETKQNDFSWANITTQSRFIAYNDRSYLPIAFLFKVSRVLGLSFATMIMLGKFGNLLLFTGISYLAIKYAKIGKPLIAILALLPHIMFAATAITYDGVVNAFLLLAVVLTTNIIVEREKPLLWWQGLVLLGVYIGGSTAKPIYMIMSLMLLFLPNKKFPNKIQAYLFRVCVVVLTGLMLYTVFFPPVSTSSSYELMNNLAYAGDKRNQGTSVLGQIQYIIANPIAYTKLLLTSIFGEFWNYVSGKRPFLLYGYLGSLNKYMNIACVLLLGFAALIGPKDQERNTIGIKYKGLNLLMVFGLTAIIWTSMYISYTAVGNPVIEGVQARYFIPLLLPFGYCLYHTKWRCPLKKHTYYTILFAFVIALNVVATYTLALKPLNF